MAIDEIRVVGDIVGPQPGQTGNVHAGNAHGGKHGENSPPSRSRVVLEEVG
jgi:hypothetical protein